MDDQLMLGILLIIVGIAMALIAVALVLNRREDLIEEAALKAADDLEPVEAEEAEELEEAVEAPLEEMKNLDEDREVEEEQAEDTSERPPLERRLVAEVYREEVTGRLIVLSGDREYTESKQVTDENERRRLAYAASDLADWFQGEFEPKTATGAAPAIEPGSPDQMLEEINEILQRSLSGKPEQGVRLFPDAVGGVKVFVGVKSYDIDDVPDEEIKDLIRQAVAEWEAGQ